MRGEGRSLRVRSTACYYATGLIYRMHHRLLSSPVCIGRLVRKVKIWRRGENGQSAGCCPRPAKRSPPFPVFRVEKATRNKKARAAERRRGEKSPGIIERLVGSLAHSVRFGSLCMHATVVANNVFRESPAFRTSGAIRSMLIARRRPKRRTPENRHILISSLRTSYETQFSLVPLTDSFTRITINPHYYFLFSS